MLLNEHRIDIVAPYYGSEAAHHLRLIFTCLAGQKGTCGCSTTELNDTTFMAASFQYMPASDLIRLMIKSA